MQITLMQNNSTENIIIKQTSENGNYSRAVIYTQQSPLFARFSVLFSLRPLILFARAVFSSSNDNSIMELKERSSLVLRARRWSDEISKDPKAFYESRGSTQA